MMESVKNNNYKILGDLFHKFEPQGFTGIILLSESHLAIHTWPELSSISMDIFSCKNYKSALKVIDEIKIKIPHEYNEVKVLKR